MSRRPLDAYQTPPWQVAALCYYVPAIAGTIWEPCVGDGSLVSELLKGNPKIEQVVTMDINPAVSPMLVGDATRVESWQMWTAAHGRPDWVITNPPFKDQFPILQHAVDVAKVGVVFLSRLSFVEPTRIRGPWLHDHPHDQRIVLERHSYAGNGQTDSATTEWLVYVKDWKILTPPFGISAFNFRPRSR